jgi:hypothetical protein
MDILLLTDKMNSSQIRRQWYEGEWYYNTVDVVSLLLDADFKRAQNYYHVMKRHIIKNYGKPLDVKQLKTLASDSKTYLADFTNIQGVKIIQEYIEPRTYRKDLRVKQFNTDEVANFHPQVISRLNQRGYTIKHHVTLPSGSVIDIVAVHGDKTYIVECKIELTKAKLHQAIGQVLCYCCEYEGDAIPVIATYSVEVNEYTQTCCRKLGVEIITID